MAMTKYIDCRVIAYLAFFGLLQVYNTGDVTYLQTIATDLGETGSACVA